MATNGYAQDALARCATADERNLLDLINDLKNLDFLNGLDEKSIAAEGNPPPNLFQLLECIAKNIVTTPAAESFADLAASPYFREDDVAGSARRYELVVSSGFIRVPSPKLLSFLQGETSSSGSENLTPAVRSLASIGTYEALNILYQNIFNLETSVLSESIRDISLSNYTLFLGENRDKLPVLTFMTDAIYKSDMRQTVVDCLVEDVIKRTPNPRKHIHLAPLNNLTPNGVALAQKLSTWIIDNGEDLKEFENFAAITKRVTDLLGIEATEPASGETAVVKKWVVEQLEKALAVEKDMERRNQIQTALAGAK